VVVVVVACRPHCHLPTSPSRGGHWRVQASEAQQERPTWGEGVEVAPKRNGAPSEGLGRVEATCEPPLRLMKAVDLGKRAWAERWWELRAPRESWRGDESRHERREVAGEAAQRLLYK